MRAGLRRRKGYTDGCATIYQTHKDRIEERALIDVKLNMETKS